LPPAVVKTEYDLFVPLEDKGGEEYLLKDRDGSDEILIPVEDAIPIISGTLQIRLELFAQRVVAELLANLGLEVDRANERLR
jgi:hypothetical protein